MRSFTSPAIYEIHFSLNVICPWVLKFMCLLLYKYIYCFVLFACKIELTQITILDSLFFINIKYLVSLYLFLNIFNDLEALNLHIKLLIFRNILTEAIFNAWRLKFDSYLIQNLYNLRLHLRFIVFFFNKQRQTSNSACRLQI